MGSGTCTAAYVAACRDRCGVLGVLLGAPFSVDPAVGNTSNGRAPIHIACAFDAADAVTLLLDHGADANLVDKDGQTPCMFAANLGNTACLRALAEGGRVLNVNAVATGGGWKGLTALDLALRKKANANSTNKEEAAAYLRDELGALTAADCPPPRKPPKSAAKTGRRSKAV